MLLAPSLSSLTSFSMSLLHQRSSRYLHELIRYWALWAKIFVRNFASTTHILFWLSQDTFLRCLLVSHILRRKKHGSCHFRHWACKSHFFHTCIIYIHGIFVLIHVFYYKYLQMKVLKVLLAVVLVFTSLLLLMVELVHDKSQRKIITGTCAVVLAVAMYASPLTVMVTNK